MRNRLVLTLALVAVASLFTPLYAQDAATTAVDGSVKMWSVITAGFALAFAAGLGALAQARGLSSAAEGIARNPAAAGEIRGALILGLVLIESLVIYVLLVALILFFANPFVG